MLKMLKTAINTFVVGVVVANPALGAEFSPEGSDFNAHNTTSLLPPYAENNSGLGHSVDVEALEWTRTVNNILSSEVNFANHAVGNVVCFFSVGGNGKILSAVRFSRSIEPALAKKLGDAIVHAKLPPLPHKKTKKIYFEIAQNGDTAVGFAK